MPQAKPGYEVAVCGREDDLRRCYLGWFGTGRFVTTVRFHVLVCVADEEEKRKRKTTLCDLFIRLVTGVVLGR